MNTTFSLKRFIVLLSVVFILFLSLLVVPTGYVALLFTENSGLMGLLFCLFLLALLIVSGTLYRKNKKDMALFLFAIYSAIILYGAYRFHIWGIFTFLG
ncbi:MAG TPA: hypothetical protein VJI96_03745 [Candidatus Andersenbacteria bacterium]|nr:hypothetical protein [Candidatus Andersenbacteria bacterium]